MKITGIGFTGRMKAGKDTSANFLKEEFLRSDEPSIQAFTQLAFADSLKQICMEHLGLTHHQCYDQDGKEEYNKFWGMTNREILQRIGTEAMRNGFHKDVWAKITELRIKDAIKRNAFFIITDVRFPNEAETIRRNGGVVVRIIRPNIESNGIVGHASEQDLPGRLIDGTVYNDGSLDDLHKKIKKLIKLTIG